MDQPLQICIAEFRDGVGVQWNQRSARRPVIRTTNSAEAHCRDQFLMRLPADGSKSSSTIRCRLARRASSVAV